MSTVAHMELENLGDGVWFSKKGSHIPVRLIHLLGEANPHIIPLKGSSCVFLQVATPSIPDWLLPMDNTSIHILNNFCIGSEGNVVFD